MDVGTHLGLLHQTRISLEAIDCVNDVLYEGQQVRLVRLVTRDFLLVWGARAYGLSVFPCLTWVLPQSNRGLAPSLCLRCWPLPRMECGIALFSAEQTTQEEAGPTWKAFTHVT